MKTIRVTFTLPIPRESITVLPVNDYERSIGMTAKYEWLCPQCQTKVHGDSKSDSLFEIRRDPLCITCRVKNGEFTFDGSTYRRVPNQTKS